MQFVCHTPRGAEGGLQRCGQRRCSPSPRAAARLCVRRLACWFQLLESSAFVVAGDYERGGLAAHTCPPLRGSAAQGLAAIYTTSGPWMASGAPSATTVPQTSVPSQGSAPPVNGRGGSGGAGAREVAPRGLPSLHEGSGHGQPEQRRREGRPAPAARMAVLFSDAGRGVSRANCRTLQPVWHRLGTSRPSPRPHGTAVSAARLYPVSSCRFVRVCFYHETVISPPRPATARVATRRHRR